MFTHCSCILVVISFKMAFIFISSSSEILICAKTFQTWSEWRKIQVCRTKQWSQVLKICIKSAGRCVNCWRYIIWCWNRKLQWKVLPANSKLFSTSDFPNLILTNKPKVLIALLLLDICQKIICFLTSNSTSHSQK